MSKETQIKTKSQAASILGAKGGNSGLENKKRDDYHYKVTLPAAREKARAARAQKKAEDEEKKK